MASENRAREWVDQVDPGRVLPAGHRVMLILAFGAGMDAGFDEAQAMIAEETGVVSVPMITDMAAFDARTADIRARGFAEEADSRDKFAHGGES